ncbi:Protein ssh4 [Massospora cicadina]|nr:Protein ssh4 [Massospora cicadina]
MLDLSSIFLIFGSAFMLLLLIQFARILKTRGVEPMAELGLPHVEPMAEVASSPTGTLLSTQAPNRTFETWLFALTSPLINRVSTGPELELHFIQRCSIQTILPFPQVRDNCYFEIKLIELTATTNLVIGLSPKDETYTKFPGKGKHSVGLESDSGLLFINNLSHEYGDRLVPGDVVGCGFRPQTDRVFFTRNGRRYPRVVFEAQNQDIYPTLYADGPCVVGFNFGQHGFTLASANSRVWAYGPQSTGGPAPSYAHHSTDFNLRSSRYFYSELNPAHPFPVAEALPTLRPPPYVPNYGVDPPYAPLSSPQY